MIAEVNKRFAEEYKIKTAAALQSVIDKRNTANNVLIGDQGVATVQYAGRNLGKKLRVLRTLPCSIKAYLD